MVRSKWLQPPSVCLAKIQTGWQYLQMLNVVRNPVCYTGMVPRETKEGLLGQKGVVVWFTGGWAALPSPSPSRLTLSPMPQAHC